MTRDFDESTLWRISAYERLRHDDGSSAFAALERATALPSTLHAELSQLRHRQQSRDALQVVAACLRQRESALVCLRHDGLVWPLTLFPRDNLYHVPRDFIPVLQRGARDLEVLDVEPPGLRPPGHAMHERIADRPGYRSLTPLLWALALHGPQATLLPEIGGRAAYRVPHDLPDVALVGGAMGAALARLRSEIASLADIARWPGMSAERAARLLNGAYLQGGLIVLHTHRSARHEAGSGRRLLASLWRKGEGG